MAISGSWNNDFNNKSQYSEYKNCFETQEGIYKLIYSTDLSSHDRETHNVNNINTNTPVRLSFLNRKKLQNSDEIELIDESQTDMICVNFGKELYVYPFDNYNINQENLSPLDKRLYKCTFPTCHDFNKCPSKSISILLIVGFTGGQIQLIDPIKKDQCKLFNEERHIDKTLVTCIKWVPTTPNQFLVSHASGYLYLYNEDLPCGALAPTYQVFKQGCKYCIYTCKTKSTRNPLYRWEFESPEYSSSSYGIEKYVNNYSGLSHSVSSLLSSSRYCAINEFAFSPSGQWLAIASQDGFLRIFDYHKMELQGSMRSYFGGIICLDWSPDDKFIVVGGQDDLVTIWSVQDQVVVCRGQGHKSWVSTVKFDPFMCPSNDDLQTVRNNSATDTSENNEENVQVTKNNTDIMNSNTYRFGSVGQDTLLCLWELTEDVIRQALKFSNNQKEKIKNDCSKINNNDENYILNSDYLSSNSSATIPKIKLKGSLLKTTKLITNNQNESNHHLNNQSNYSTASLSQKFVHSLGGILGNGSSNIDRKHFTFSGGSVSFKSNQKLSESKQNGSTSMDSDKKYLGTSQCPKLEDVPILEPIVSKHVSNDRLTDLVFREETVLCTSQQGTIYAWTRPGYTVVKTVLNNTDIDGKSSVSLNSLNQNSNPQGNTSSWSQRNSSLKISRTIQKGQSGTTI